MTDTIEPPFRPYDQACFDKLNQRFEFLFEPRLINDICRYGTIRKYKDDTVIIDIGDMMEFMPLVITGSVKVITEDKEGRELLLYYLELGDTCAVTLNCCARRSKSSIRAIAETESEIVMIPIGKLDEWMVKYSTWRNFVMESYRSRIDEMLESIDNLAFHNMEERIYKYLRDKVLVTKDPVLNISHAQIANDLNSSRVVVSRLVKKLEIDGKVKQHRNKIEIVEFQ